MASLKSTNIATSATVGGGAVWHTGNQGSTSGADTGLNAGQIWGWNDYEFDIPSRTTALTLGGNTSNYYPIIFAQNAWDAGSYGTPLIMDIRRTDADQTADGAGTGTFFMKLKYRATNWGFHQNHWEILENYASPTATQYPFVANVAQPGTSAWLGVWMKGGLHYHFAFGTQAAVFDSNCTTSRNKGVGNGSGSYLNGDSFCWENPTLTGGGVGYQTTLSVPSYATYFQQDLCSKGYDLGQSSFRASNVYVTSTSISSDERVKDNFGVTFGTEFIELLKPVSYTFKGDWDDGKLHYGLLAQDVKDAMDQLGITEDEFAGYDGRNPDMLSLLYDEFIPIIVKTIQEEENIMTNLKTRISALEAKHGGV